MKKPFLPLLLLVCLALFAACSDNVLRESGQDEAFTLSGPANVFSASPAPTPNANGAGAAPTTSPGGTGATTSSNSTASNTTQPAGGLVFQSPSPMGYYAKRINELPYVSETVSNRTEFLPKMGDYVQFPTDVISVQVQAAYLQKLPPLDLVSDMVLFAEIWEDAANGYGDPDQISIVYIGKNQMTPAKLNFLGNLAYGPTFFNQHPLKIRFTVMFLQHKAGQEGAQLANSLSQYANMVPGYGAAATQSLKVMKDVLTLLPNVISFDFETTLVPYYDPNNLTVHEDNGLNGLIVDDGNWLRYQNYAIIETQPYQLSFIAAGLPRNQPTTKDTPPTITDPDQVSYLYYNGYMHQAPPGGTEAQPPLPPAYIVFSIIPGGQPEKDSVLRKASSLNASLMQNLEGAKTGTTQATTIAKQYSQDTITQMINEDIKSSVYNSAVQYSVLNPGNYDYQTFFDQAKNDIQQRIGDESIDAENNSNITVGMLVGNLNFVTGNTEEPELNGTLSSNLTSGLVTGTVGTGTATTATVNELTIKPGKNGNSTATPIGTQTQNVDLVKAYIYDLFNQYNFIFNYLTNQKVKPNPPPP
jgi:hypothetical protein